MENEQDDTESNSISTYYDEDEEPSSSGEEEEEEEEEEQKRVRFCDQVTDSSSADSSSSDEEEGDQRNRPQSVVYVPLSLKNSQSKGPVQTNGAVSHRNWPERRLLVGMSADSNGVPKSTNVDSGVADNLSSSEDGDVRFSPLPIMATSPVPPNVILPASEGREKIKQLESTDNDTTTSSAQGKCIQISIGIGKGLALLALLYFFICSLDTLSLGFRLIGGRTAGEIFRKSDVLQNPVVGLMIGILATVFVQSSSTSTSIIVGMVAAGFLEVPVAIPLIMGANIGTSITNTIVSLSQAGDRDQFRLAFAGATILDMFNWITVIVLLPLEIVSGYLYHLSNAMMNSIMPDTQAGGEFQLLSVLTNPLVDRIVQLDPEVIECWSNPACNSDLLNASLLREYCGVSNSITIEFTQTRLDTMGRMIAPVARGSKVVENRVKCDFLFAGTPLSDAAAGAIILICSLVVLCGCLVLIVKLLSSVIQGHLAIVIKKTINADIPYVPWVTGYLAIIVGAIMTFIVQSSSVFTSSITPLIGLGVISIERAYPLTLGANVGTTTTALLASMAVEGKAFRPSMQIALCHMIFNLSGIALFYPISFLRFPIPMAKFLGTTTSKYRWFAIFYMALMFGILPAITILLSLGGPIPVLVFCALASIILLFIFTLTLIQRKKPTILPPVLRTWKFLPAPLRSLEPYDKFFTSFKCCRKLKEKANNQSSNKPANNDSTTNKPVELYQLGEDEV